MSIQYRIEYFCNDDQCWIDDEETNTKMEKNFANDCKRSALAQLRYCTNSEPEMAHRLVKIETIALSVRGETLIAGA